MLSLKRGTMTENQDISYHQILGKLHRCKPGDETETRILLVKALDTLQFDLTLLSNKIAEMTEAIDIRWK